MSGVQTLGKKVVYFLCFIRFFIFFCKFAFFLFFLFCIFGLLSFFYLSTFLFCTFVFLYFCTFVLLYFHTFSFGWTVHMNFHAKSRVCSSKNDWVMSTFIFFVLFVLLQFFGLSIQTSIQNLESVAQKMAELLH